MAVSTKEKNFLDNCDKSNPFFNALLRNLDDYLKKTKTSLREFSEKTDIPLETLRSIVYHKTNTCRMPTAIAIAKQLDMTLDELVDSGLIEQEVREGMKMIKSFSYSERQLLRWYVRKIHSRHMKYPGKKMVTIMNPVCVGGSLKSNNEYSALDVSDLPSMIMQTAFFGIVIPCDCYIPHYFKGNILLLSSDRNPYKGEHCVINVENNIYIVSFHEEDGKMKFRSIINKMPLPFEAKAADIVGYISYVLQE